MKFSRRAFVRWLKEKTALTRVGPPENRRSCPLCEFLKAQGAKRVDMDFVRRSVDGTLTANPSWARKFQRAACDFVDNDATGKRQITAKRALSFL